MYMVEGEEGGEEEEEEEKREPGGREEEQINKAQDIQVTDEQQRCIVSGCSYFKESFVPLD